VLKENLDGHVKRCPLLKQVQSLTLQPFYQKGINAGRDDAVNDEEQEEGEDLGAINKPVLGSLDDISSEMKRRAVYGMSVPEFCKLIEKIEDVHGLICKDIRDSYNMPEACNIWINREIDR
jgi:tRNA:m4X modification enzyme